MKPNIKKLGKTIRDFIRGALKSLPGPNAILEGIENVKANKVNAENVTEVIENTNANRPHSWTSIITQLALTGTFIYLFLTKQLTVEKLQELLTWLVTLF